MFRKVTVLFLVAIIVLLMNIAPAMALYQGQGNAGDNPLHVGTSNNPLYVDNNPLHVGD